MAAPVAGVSPFAGRSGGEGEEGEEASGSGFEEDDVSVYEDSQIGDMEASGSGKRHSPPGCLSLIEALSSRLHAGGAAATPMAGDSAGTGDGADGSVAGGAGGLLGKQRSSRKHRQSSAGPGAGHFVDRPQAGVSLERRDTTKSATELRMCYEDGDGKHYNIRGIDYMKTKIKVKSDCSIYRLAAADMFTFDHKQNHIAQLVNLPRMPTARHRMSPGSDACYPPMLVLNLQLPMYAPSFFGKTDGPGWSIVLYFVLPDDFNPTTFPNQKALGLYRRFVQNGKEADGSFTRDRFKIIPRVVNVDEWAVTGPLSSAEYKLLSNYNEKPVLSRPQHLFFLEHDYLEVDLDIHTYSYVAKTALQSFMPRLGQVIWETAFVVQGNSPDELPEQVLACARIFRTDFLAQRPFAKFVPRSPGPAAASHALVSAAHDGGTEEKAPASIGGV